MAEAKEECEVCPAEDALYEEMCGIITEKGSIEHSACKELLKAVPRRQVELEEALERMGISLGQMQSVFDQAMKNLEKTLSQ